jgi:hypothetical protein
VGCSPGLYLWLSIASCTAAWSSIDMAASVARSAALPPTAAGARCVSGAEVRAGERGPCCFSEVAPHRSHAPLAAAAESESNKHPWCGESQFFYLSHKTGSACAHG